MALYQPSNIVPSAWAGEGNNAVSISDYISISWQVNGNSPMTSFSISIYPNTGNSTTDATPVATLNGTPDSTLYPNGFYPVDSKGNQQYYTYAPNLKWSDLSLVAGGKYKYQITQSWSEGGTTKSLTQISFNSFIVLTKPQLAFNPSSTFFPNQARLYIPSSMVSYSQAQNDTIKTTRWQLYRTNSTWTEDLELIDDTGIIFTSETAYVFDGLMPQTKYKLVLEITTISGLSAMASININSNYTVSGTFSIVPCKGNGVVNVAIEDTNGKIYSFPAEITTWSGGFANIDIEKQLLNISNNAYVRWDNVQIRSNDMIADTYTIEYSCRIKASTLQSRPFDTLIGIYVIAPSISTGSISISVGEGTVSVYSNGESVGSFSLATFPSITENFDTIYTISATCSNTVNGMSFTLSNGQTIYTNNSLQFSSAQIQVNGQQETTILSINNRENFAQIDQPFILQFQDESMNGGNYSLTGVYGFSAYRTTGTKQKKLGSIPTAYLSFVDYGVSPGVESQYAAFYKSINGEYTSYSQSEIVCPTVGCFYLLQTQKSHSDPSMYVVQKKWKFNSNANNGTVTNNNTPNWLTNFTPYRLPQPTKRMGRSGSLSGLISNPVDGKYSDTAEQMDEIFALSQSRSTFFLKDPKGNLYIVHISAPITSSPAWGTPTMQTTFSLPWEEIGDASKYSVIEYGELREV